MVGIVSTKKICIMESKYNAMPFYSFESLLFCYAYLSWGNCRCCLLECSCNVFLVIVCVFRMHECVFYREKATQNSTRYISLTICYMDDSLLWIWLRCLEIYKTWSSVDSIAPGMSVYLLDYLASMLVDRLKDQQNTLIIAEKNERSVFWYPLAWDRLGTFYNCDFLQRITHCHWASNIWKQCVIVISWKLSKNGLIYL